MDGSFGKAYCVSLEADVSGEGGSEEVWSGLLSYKMVGEDIGVSMLDGERFWAS